jgi:copper chaperone
MAGTLNYEFAMRIHSNTHLSKVEPSVEGGSTFNKCITRAAASLVVCTKLSRARKSKHFLDVGTTCRMITIKTIEMKTLKFKTNIMCSGCVATVTPFLNAEKEIISWEVDTTTMDKILTVTTDSSAETIQKAIEKAGYKSQPL